MKRRFRRLRCIHPAHQFQPMTSSALVMQYEQYFLLQIEKVDVIMQTNAVVTTAGEEAQYFIVYNNCAVRFNKCPFLQCYHAVNEYNLLLMNW